MKSQRMHFPAYVEISPDGFKSTLECSIDEILSARKVEPDRHRCRELSKLLKVMKDRGVTAVKELGLVEV